jgi:8-oxo-dGTP pyrophosphatase MutT (NUDIX family)
MTRFLTPSFDACEKSFFQWVFSQAQQDKPSELFVLSLGHQPLGLITHQQAQRLGAWLPLQPVPGGWSWQAESLTPLARSAQLRVAALALREEGLITGWRDEDYASWGTVDVPGEPGEDELFRLERAAFRYFGFRSHAVHINGFTPEGAIWRAQRAWTKPTDPGLGDNLAAGGLSAGETVWSCAWRELREEAGLLPQDVSALTFVGSMVTQRQVPEGWHSESLQVFNALLKPGVTPISQDGEVQAFHCLSPDEVMSTIYQQTWTVDAACAMVLGWRSLQIDANSQTTLNNFDKDIIS